MGLELGRERLLAVLVNAHGSVIYNTEMAAVPPLEAVSHVVEGLAAAATKAAAAANMPWGKVVAVGIALPGVVDAMGQWSLQSTPQEEALPVTTLLRKALSRTVVAEDVSRSFAFAEQRVGKGKDQADAAYVFIGQTGVGGGIFVNHQLLKSSHGVCGEVGHVAVVPEGKQCQCGSRGCLETVATPQAVVERYQALLEQGVASFLQPSDITFQAICSAAAQGDKAAYLMLDELAQHMAKALAATINISGAPYVIVGGPLKRAGESFRYALETALKRRVVGPLLNDVSVHYAELSEFAGAWGVALQALDLALADGTFLDVGDASIEAEPIAGDHAMA
jgi:predicted NBD/HSP70 family sugar kinase